MFSFVIERWKSDIDSIPRNERKNIRFFKKGPVDITDVNENSLINWIRIKTDLSLLRIEFPVYFTHIIKIDTYYPIVRGEYFSLKCPALIKSGELIIFTKNHRLIFRTSDPREGHYKMRIIDLVFAEPILFQHQSGEIIKIDFKETDSKNCQKNAERKIKLGKYRLEIYKNDSQECLVFSEKN